jgi:hypothetical protein
VEGLAIIQEKRDSVTDLLTNRSSYLSMISTRRWIKKIISFNRKIMLKTGSL